MSLTSLPAVSSAEDQINHTLTAFTFIAILVAAFVAELIGIHAFFGAFIMGGYQQ
jgi:Kef-type K+ transport system membrane component KefB